MPDVETLFHMFGNRNRLAILTALAEENSPHSFSDLRELLRLNPNTLAFHLESLEYTGLVSHELVDNEKRRYSMYYATTHARELLRKYEITYGMVQLRD